MDIDDLEPRKQKPKPKDLESLGVDELEEYIAQLKAEIARVREDISAKQGHMSDAESVFKS